MINCQLVRQVINVIHTTHTITDQRVLTFPGPSVGRIRQQLELLDGNANTCY